jgi:glycosyltransferase involved in cell wall biosynthesis
MRTMPPSAASCCVAERDVTPKAPRIAVVGVSDGVIDGARDYAVVLTSALVAQGASAQAWWFTRSHLTGAASVAEMSRWSRAVEGELRTHAPDVVLFHYNVFVYSYRGLPVFVPRVLRAIRAGGAPVISVLHEVAYPFRHRGWRAKLWAVSQRALLIPVMRASSAGFVTADFRAAWLGSRRWLPKRPVALAPVHSALPPPLSSFSDNGAGPRLGLFGYAFQGVSVSLVLDALRELRGSYPEVQLVLLGAPGADSPVGEKWLALARAKGVADAVSFSGTLSMQELSDAIAASELLLFADETGPASRKSSLAAALASGRPVVAIDGPRRWQELVDASALSVAAPAPDAIARAVRTLLDDPAEREALGARGQRFAQERMSPATGARAILELYARLTP